MRFSSIWLVLPSLAMGSTQIETLLKSQPQCKSDILQAPPRPSCNPDDPTEVAGIGDRLFATLLKDPGLLISSDICVLDPNAQGPRADLIRFFRDTYFPLMKKLSPDKCDHVDVAVSGTCISACALLSRIQELIAEPCKVIDEVKAKSDSLSNFRTALKLASRLPYVKVVAKQMGIFLKPIEDSLEKLVDKLDPKGNRCSETEQKAKNFRKKLMDKLYEIAETVDRFNGRMATRLDYMCLQINFEHSVLNNASRRSRNLRDMTTLANLHEAVATDDEGQRRLDSRFLKFNEDNIDVDSLLNCMPDLQELINDVNRIIQEIECFVTHVEDKVEAFLSIFKKSFAFLFDGPFDAILDILHQINFIVEKVSFLQCPSFLGPVCDLDSLIADFIEDLLKQIGFDVGKILNDILGKLGIGFPDLDIFFVKFPFPEIDFKFLDIDLFSIPDLDGLFDRLIPTIGDILPCLSKDPLDDAFTNFDTLQNTDGVIGGVAVEYRLAKGDLNSVNVLCPANQSKFPFVLSASYVDACGRIDITGETRRPCSVGDVRCEIPIDQLRQGRDCSKKEDSLVQAGLGYSKGLVDESTVFYTCIDSASIGKIDALPDTNSHQYTPNDAPTSFRRCTGDMTLEPLGFELKKGSVAHLTGGYKFKFGRVGQNPQLLPETVSRRKVGRLAHFFGASCRPGNQSCPTGLGKSPHGMIYLEERHNRKTGPCREDFVTQVVPVNRVYSRCLIPGRDLAESDRDSGIIVNGYHRSRGKNIYNYNSEFKYGELSGKSIHCGVESKCIRSIIYLHLNPGEPKVVKQYTPWKLLPVTSGLRTAPITCPTGKVPKVREYVFAKVLQDGTVDEKNKKTSEEPKCCRSTDESGRCRGSIVGCDGENGLHFQYPGGSNTAFRFAYDCLCGDGFLPHEDAKGQCIPCDKGTFRIGTAMSQCDACPPGSYTDATGMAQCTLAPIGTFVEQSQQSGFEFCPPGTTTAEKGAKSIDQCVRCETGLVSARLGRSQVCRPCRNYYWPNESASACIPYRQPGSYASQGKIVQCEAGEYLATQQADQFVKAGQFLVTDRRRKDDRRLQFCSLCPHGSYTRSPGMSGCLACGIGFYADSEGLSSCLPCPTGTTTLDFGSIDLSQCIERPTVDYTSPMFKDFTCQELLAYKDASEPVDFIIDVSRRESMIGDGMCNIGPWNTEQCGWDGGDCCRESCTAPNPDTTGDEAFTSDFACTHSTFACLDPRFFGKESSLVDSSRGSNGGVWWTEEEEICRGGDESGIDAISWTAAAISSAKGDGVCDLYLNEAEFGFDGGDCCVKSCKPNPSFPWQSCTSNCHCHASKNSV